MSNTFAFDKYTLSYMIGAMNIQETLKELVKNGVRETYIEEMTGIPQGTINRIKNGKHKDTSASRGEIIKNFAKEILPDIFGK